MASAILLILAGVICFVAKEGGAISREIDFDREQKERAKRNEEVLKKYYKK